MDCGLVRANHERYAVAPELLIAGNRTSEPVAGGADLDANTVSGQQSGSVGWRPLLASSSSVMLRLARAMIFRLNQIALVFDACSEPAPRLIKQA